MYIVEEDLKALLHLADVYGIIRTVPNSYMDKLCIQYLHKGYIQLLENTKYLNVYRLKTPQNNQY